MPQEDKAQALQLINQYTDTDGLHVSELCDHLSKIVMTFTYTVFEIFNILTERQFSQADHESVCRNLINRINPANMVLLAESIHGLILLDRIQYILNCQYNVGDETCRYIATADARAKEIEREKTPRQLSEQEIAFYTERGQNQPFGAIKGGRVKGKARRLFNPEVIWELPKSGIGYVVYNRNDIDGRTQKGKSIGDKLGLDQIGTKETIERIMRIAEEWHTLYPDRDLEIGDVARPGGINTTEHSTHDGTEFDIRPQSKSKTVGPLSWSLSPYSDYSFSLTKEFILLVRRLYPTTEFHFNDPAILKDNDTKNFVTPEDFHDDHLHDMFK